MSGHSKWANIKRRKAAVDDKKGRVFSRLAREIAAAARSGGGNPDANATLKAAIERAREQNLPMDNIQRAIARGAGGEGGEAYEEVVYEGFGPGAVAVLVQALTDNRNRTAADIRHLFAKSGGNLGETGSVAWMFNSVGTVFVRAAAAGEEALIEIGIEAGAEDVQSDEDGTTLQCAPAQLSELRAAITAAGIEVDESEVMMVATVHTAVEGEVAERLLRFLETLEDHDDVQKVYANFEIDDAELARLQEA